MLIKARGQQLCRGHAQKVNGSALALLNSFFIPYAAAWEYVKAVIGGSVWNFVLGSQNFFYFMRDLCRGT